MRMKLTPGGLAQLGHREFVQLFAADFSSPLLAREFMARYDRVIRQALAQALQRFAAGERQQDTLDESVNEIYCLLFQRHCRALRRLRSRYENSIFAYLRTVCWNSMNNQLRDETRKHGFIRPVSTSLPEERATGFSAGAVEWCEFEERIWGVLQRSFRARIACRNFIIFKLRFLYGYRYHEIARIKALGLGSQGVANTAARIRKRLHREFRS